MPIYLFKCSTCGLEFELFQNHCDDPLPECPNACNKDRTSNMVYRLISPCSFILKGNCWSQDGYSRGKK